MGIGQVATTASGSGSFPYLVDNKMLAFFGALRREGNGFWPELDAQP